MFSGFFNRPILLLVLVLAVLLTAGIGAMALLVGQYLRSPLPTVEVSASYPGANAQMVADTVAAPIEQQLYGVEDMIAMSRQCTDDGAYRLTITFRRGTDVKVAQVLVQNRISLALPILPDAVQRAGLRVMTQPTR